ncbi:hypothetical protein SAMN05216167_108194 [Spirosoma endophyticum]|uniref:Uncharacterized protein n=1 Tax=Spirosoma endophyticum TaxID=662367 RepID=A0A1I1W9Y4_9BACT|nr:hypothetical protein SAMN05216167_108194 [Spirosoma endophyticum]
MSVVETVILGGTMILAVLVYVNYTRSILKTNSGPVPGD